MADETKQAPASLPVADVKTETVTLMLTIPVKVTRVIPTQSRSPANELIDIVEIEPGLPNDGNCDFMRWMDFPRFQCERGKANGLLKTMGLK